MHKINETIFVAGFPRSGTTWFSNLINSHPSTLYRHEMFGRDFDRFGEDLFNALKYDNGLSDADYEQAVSVVIKPSTNTDKPPFFRKDFYSIPSIKLQKLFWLAAKSNTFSEKLYAALFQPRKSKAINLVIKETRSSVNLDSMIQGIRASKLLILVRHPYAVIASHVKGQQSGHMSEKNSAYRREWYEAAQHSDYVKKIGLTEDALLQLSEVEFLAIDWRFQNEDYLAMMRNHPSPMVLIYEEFLADTLKCTQRLFEFLNLEFHEGVKAFINESSSSSASTNLITKDASTEYYSVYRGSEFNPNKWREILSDSELDTIDEHTQALVEHFGVNQWVAR